MGHRAGALARPTASRPNPGGWLTTTAGNKAIDRIRREGKRDREARGGHDAHTTTHPPSRPVRSSDDRLRLIFTCCHPALAPENRIALTLRLLGGLTVAEIAQAFLVPRPRWPSGSPGRSRRSRRRTSPTGCRAKPTWSSAGRRRAGGAVPDLQRGLPATGPRRLRDRPVGRGDPVDPPARRAARSPDPEVDGLLALMLLTEARRDARVADGVLVTLDRPGPVPLGRGPDRRGPRPGTPLPGNQPTRALPAPGSHQRRAHRRPRRLDDRLVARSSSSTTSCWRRARHRSSSSTARSRSPSSTVPRSPWRIVDAARPADVPRLHVTRAELLRRLGRHEESRAAYDAALALVENEAERAHLLSRSASLPG